jgi:hypothetical protein
VQKIEPERLFSFTWHHSFDPNADISKEPTTLVEFRLEKIEAGTLLTVIESGFENLPEDVRFEAFRRNEGGWTEQMKNIDRYVSQQY